MEGKLKFGDFGVWNQIWCWESLAVAYLNAVRLMREWKVLEYWFRRCVSLHSFKLILAFNFGFFSCFADFSVQLGKGPLSSVKPVLAVLAFIGGVDPRPRLGGRVLDGDFGAGTVSSISTRGRLLVHFDGHRIPQLVPIQRLKPVRFELMWVLISIIKNSGISGAASLISLLLFHWYNTEVCLTD